MDVGAGLDELGREPERLRRRVRVLEPPGVGDERDVERLGELRRQLDAELGENVPQNLAGRGRVGDDEVEVAEARVVVVVVDVEGERRARTSGVVADALLLRAVDREEHPLGRVVRRLAHEVGERHEPVLARQRRRGRAGT